MKHDEKDRRKTFVEVKLSCGQTANVRIQRHGNTKWPRLILERGGSLALMTPPNFSSKQVINALEALMPLLEKKVKVSPVGSVPLLPAKIAIPLLNREFSLEVTSKTAVSPVRKQFDGFLPYEVKINKLYLLIGETSLIISGHDDQAGTICALQRFFWNLAKYYLPVFLKALAECPPLINVAVRNQRSIMGSCAKRKGSTPVINLNWRGFFLPKPMLVHLCQHELAHLKHMAHNAEFYNCLEKASPDCRKKEKDLNKAWQDLPDWLFWQA